MKTLKTVMMIVTLGLISSAASADMIWLQMAPGSTPTPGGTVEIQMLADTDIDFWRLEGATAPAGTSVSNFQVHALAGNPSTFNAMPGYVDNVTYGGLTYLWNEAFCQSNRGTMPAGEILMSFDLQIHSTWDGITPFTLDLLEAGELYYWDAGESPLTMQWNPYGKIMGGSNLPIADLTIPEPATLCLLTGGGVAMLLRRRRAKNN